MGGGAGTCGAKSSPLEATPRGVELLRDSWRGAQDSAPPRQGVKPINPKPHGFST